jgi:hypothetical protein
LRFSSAIVAISQPKTDLSLATTSPVAFGLFGANDPGLGNLDQHGAICLRSGARQPAALRSVVAKFLSVGIFVFGIDFHIEFRIAIDSSVSLENRDKARKFLFKFSRLMEPISVP